MSKPKSRKHVEEYDSDDGFVEDAPKSKKQKKTVSNEMQKDDEDNEYWELSGKRRIQISQFKKMTMVNIREYYEKDGKALPGKKGISLTTEQYTAFIDLLPDIERVLKSKGVTVPRPQYDKIEAVSEDKNDQIKNEDGAPDVEEDEEEEESGKRRGKLDKFKMKKNHEATSDEDEE